MAQVSRREYPFFSPQSVTNGIANKSFFETPENYRQNAQTPIFLALPS